MQSSPVNGVAGWLGVLGSLTGVWLGLRDRLSLRFRIGRFLVLLGLWTGLGMLACRALMIWFFPIPGGLVSDVCLTWGLLQHAIGSLIIYCTMGYAIYRVIGQGILTLWKLQRGGEQK